MTITQSDIPRPPESDAHGSSPKPSSSAIEAALASLTDAAAKLEALHYDITDRKRHKAVAGWLDAQVQALRSMAGVLPHLVDPRSDSEFS